MAVLRLGPFLGANKAIQPKLLNANVGVESLNHWPDRGDLRPWKNPLQAFTVALGTKSFAMFHRASKADTVYWLQWQTVVHTINGFVASTTNRTYYTGSGAPKWTDSTIGLATGTFPTTYRDLGIPKPTSIPLIAQTSPGVGVDETRYYAYCYLSSHDELGPPQVSAAFTCKPGAVVSISNMAAPPSGLGEARDIDRIRIFRTSAGDSGADFFFLMDMVVGTSAVDNGLSVGFDVMPSKLYAMPPADLSNLITLWNGVAAGISGNSVRYCEQFKMHAWPVAYETLCTETPVALATFQKNLLILTTGKPRLVYGSSPEAMDDTPVEFIAACVAPQSVVSFGHGVCWATSDGLAYVGTNGTPRLLTEGLMLLDDWKAINPSSIIASQFNGKYMGFYDSGAGVLKGFMLDPMNPQAGMFFFSTGYTAAFFDPLEEEMYVLDGLNIKKWNAGTTFMVASHKTKVFHMPAPVNLCVAKVIADSYPCTVTLYADDRAAWTRSVANKEPFWLPSGYLAENYQFGISTALDVTGLVVADSLDELKA